VLLIGARVVVASDGGRGRRSASHPRSFEYWKASSSGTRKTRAIWKAISSEGEYLPCSMAMIVSTISYLFSLATRSTFVVAFVP
jgi:hypothetical protein